MTITPPPSQKVKTILHFIAYNFILLYFMRILSTEKKNLNFQKKLLNFYQQTAADWSLGALARG